MYFSLLSISFYVCAFCFPHGRFGILQFNPYKMRDLSIFRRLIRIIWLQSMSGEANESSTEYIRHFLVHRIELNHRKRPENGTTTAATILTAKTIDKRTELSVRVIRNGIQCVENVEATHETNPAYRVHEFVACTRVAATAVADSDIIVCWCPSETSERWHQR